MSKKLDLATLHAAVSGSAAAFRCRRKLQPAGGAGDKVFPPTYAGAVYAVEQRRVPGRAEPVTCVLLDSVQSQANRMEQALQDAVDAGTLKLPLIVVDFSKAELPEPVGRLTSLQLPHRFADAILRDSEHGGKRFRESDVAKGLNAATPLNATPLYELCPTALVFGAWDSTGPKGGLGTKFERALVSETMGIGAEFGIKTSSRIDPLITKTKGIVLYKKGAGWTLNPDEADKDPKSKKPIELGKGEKAGKVSASNLGNVTPSFSKYSKGAEGIDPLQLGRFDVDFAIRSSGEEFSVRNHARSEAGRARENQIAPGGVTIDHAEQITTLSLICLRRLRFPVAKPVPTKEAANAAAQTVLAALALYAATAAFESGLGLRSRCLLWPEEPMSWELLAKPGEAPQPFALTAAEGLALLNEAVGAAKSAGVTWREEPLELTPNAELVKLVALSQEQAKSAGGEADETESK
jgi:CRISPR-associated protein Csb1